MKKFPWHLPKLSLLTVSLFTKGGSTGAIETDAGGNGPLYPSGG